MNSDAVRPGGLTSILQSFPEFGCGSAALCPLWLKNLSSLSVFFRAFCGDNASVSGDSTPLPQQKDTPRGKCESQIVSHNEAP